MEQYVKKITEQFCLATGSKCIDPTSDAFINEITLWIKNRQDIAKKYTDFLDYMGFDFFGADCAEVGKGGYDSIVKPFETTIITPVLSTFKKINPERIIDGKMKVYGIVPFLIRHINNENEFTQISSDGIHTFITQNPYSKWSISKWENLHNSGLNNIILGIYGSIQDKDIEEKVKMLKLLRDKLDDEYKEDYSTLGDNYFYAIGSDRMIKRMVKTRTRLL